MSRKYIFEKSENCVSFINDTVCVYKYKTMDQLTTLYRNIMYAQKGFNDENITLFLSHLHKFIEKQGVKASDILKKVPKHLDKNWFRRMMLNMNTMEDRNKMDAIIQLIGNEKLLPDTALNFLFGDAIGPQFSRVRALSKREMGGRKIEKYIDKILALNKQIKNQYIDLMGKIRLEKMTRKKGGFLIMKSTEKFTKDRASQQLKIYNKTLTVEIEVIFRSIVDVIGVRDGIKKKVYEINSESPYGKINNFSINMDNIQRYINYLEPSEATSYENVFGRQDKRIDLREIRLEKSAVENTIARLMISEWENKFGNSAVPSVCLSLNDGNVYDCDMPLSTTVMYHTQSESFVADNTQYAQLCLSCLKHESKKEYIDAIRSGSHFPFIGHFETNNPKLARFADFSFIGQRSYLWNLRQQQSLSEQAQISESARPEQTDDAPSDDADPPDDDSSTATQ